MTYLLNPTAETRTTLIKLYREEKLEVNALFLESLVFTKLDKNVLPFLRKAAKYNGASAARVAGKLGRDGLEFLEQMKAHPCCEPMIVYDFASDNFREYNKTQTQLKNGPGDLSGSEGYMPFMSAFDEIRRIEAVFQ